jgi:hypothetical protein
VQGGGGGGVSGAPGNSTGEEAGTAWCNYRVVAEIYFDHDGVFEHAAQRLRGHLAQPAPPQIDLLILALVAHIRAELQGRQSDTRIFLGQVNGMYLVL